MRRFKRKQPLSNKYHGNFGSNSLNVTAGNGHIIQRCQNERKFPFFVVINFPILCGKDIHQSHFNSKHCTKNRYQSTKYSYMVDGNIKRLFGGPLSEYKIVLSDFGFCSYLCASSFFIIEERLGGGRYKP